MCGECHSLKGRAAGNKMAPNQKESRVTFPCWTLFFLVPLSFKNKTESKLYLFRKYLATNQWNMDAWHHLVRLWEILNLPTSNHVGTLRTWMWASLMKLSASRVQQIADSFEMELGCDLAAVSVRWRANVRCLALPSGLSRQIMTLAHRRNSFAELDRLMYFGVDAMFVLWKSLYRFS